MDQEGPATCPRDSARPTCAATGHAAADSHGGRRQARLTSRTNAKIRRGAKLGDKHASRDSCVRGERCKPWVAPRCAVARAPSICRRAVTCLAPLAASYLDKYMSLTYYEQGTANSTHHTQHPHPRLVGPTRGLPHMSRIRCLSLVRPMTRVVARRQAHQGRDLPRVAVECKSPACAVNLGLDGWLNSHVAIATNSWVLRPHPIASDQRHHVTEWLRRQAAFAERHQRDRVEAVERRP